MQTFHKSPRSKGLIWLAWIIAVLSVAMTFAAAWLAHHNNLSGMPTTVRQTVTYYLDELTSPLWAVMGALVIANKPRHANGWMLCAVGLLWSAKQFAGEYAIYSYFSLTTPAPQAAVASWVISWGWFAGFVPMIALFMTLPTGHLLSARWRIPLWIAEFGLSAICLNNAVQVWPLRGRTLFTLTESDLMAHMGPAATVAFPIVLLGSLLLGIAVLLQIGRASCRERV